MEITLAASAFPPLALGFFGLGTGYLIYGSQELAGWPKRDELVDQATGIWGIWMPGFCQFLTGITLFVGLTWFQVFANPALYMAAFAFTAFGIHWFALGWNRYRGNDARPNAAMCVAFMVISALGITVFFNAGDWPTGLVFVGLLGVYISEFFATIGNAVAERALGLIRLATAAWLMYLAFAVTVDFALRYHWLT